MKSCEEVESCILQSYPDCEHIGEKNEAVELVNKYMHQYPNIFTVGYFVVVGSFLDGSPSFFMRNQSFDMDVLWCVPRSDGKTEGLSKKETKELLSKSIDSKYPVFFRMWVSSVPSLQDAYSDIKSRVDGKDYLSTEKIKEKAFENMPLLKQSEIPSIGKASIPFKLPVSSFVNYFKKGHNFDQNSSLNMFDSWFKHMDIVPAIPCEGWPSIEVCQIQLNRIRNVDPTLAELLEKHGFHFVTKSKGSFEVREAVWMISFARAESVLAGYMDKFSRKCLSLLKLLLQDLNVIQDKDDQTDKDSLKSYYFKTVFYWWWINRKERTDKAEKDNLGESIVLLLEDCKQRLNSGFLGMFWLPDYNLFSDVDKNVLKEAEQKIQHFLQTCEITTHQKVLIPYTDRYVPLHRIYIPDDQVSMVSSYIFKEIVDFSVQLFRMEKPIDDPPKLIKEALNNTLSGMTKLLKDLEKDDVIYRTELLQPENAVEQLLERMDSEPVMQEQFRNTFKLLCLFFEILIEIVKQKWQDFLLKSIQAGMYSIVIIAFNF